MTSAEASSRPTEAADRRAVWFLTAFAAICAFGFSLAIPTYIDEAYTFNLATDSSLSHMLTALTNGADGSFPVFALFAFGWERIFGASELSLRLAGGIFTVLFVWHTGTRLLRQFRTIPTIIAVLLVLSNPTVLFYGLQARFYGLLLFSVSLLFWSTFDLIVSRAISPAKWILHALFGGLLWLSHPLGMLYGIVLAALYLLFSLKQRTFTWSNASAFIGGPGLFLLWLPSFLIQRKINVIYPPGLRVPGWQKYWEYLFLGGEVFPVMIGVGALLFVGAKLRWFQVASPEEPGPPAGRGVRHVLLLYAIAFILTLNLAIAVVDGASVLPVFLMRTIRYMVGAAIGYAVIFTAIVESADAICAKIRGRGWTRAIGPALQLVVVGSVLARMVWLWSDGFGIKATREPYLLRVTELARQKGLDILCETHIEAFYLATRTPAEEVKYVLEEDFPFRALMKQVARYYPHPEPISRAAFEQYPREFVFVPSNGQEAVIAKPGQFKKR